MTKRAIILLAFLATHVGAQTTLWNANVMTRVAPSDTAPVGAPLKPIRIVAPRGGVGSGQIIVKADSVNANVGDLVSRAGTIPKSAISIRFTTKSPDGDYFDVLSAAPVTTQSVMPVWITVTVPANAAAGEYEGRLTVNGMPVAIALKVSAFQLPVLAERAMWVSMTQSPDTVALQYKVEPYSEAHWKLLEKSLELQGQLADKVLYLPVIGKTWFGNEYGMIPFRQNGENLTPDFSVIEGYLALYMKYCGPPRAVILDVWEPYMAGDQKPGADNTIKDKVWLSTVNSAGKWEVLETAKYPDHKEMWRAVLAGAQAVVKKAGLPADVLRLGITSDESVPTDNVNFFKELAPDLNWAVFTHGYGGCPPGYIKWTYGEYPDNTIDVKAIRGGWGGDSKQVVMNTVRDRHEDTAQPIVFRGIPDASVGSYRGSHSVGLARVGLDCWPVPMGSAGKPGHIIGRFMENRTNRLYRHPDFAVTAPGLQGALSTQRFEMLREGIQDTEARIVLEKALKESRMSAESATRAEKVLLERAIMLKAMREKNMEDKFYSLAEQLLDLASDVQALAK